MKFLIPLLGKTKTTYLDAGVRDYAIRLQRFANVELPVLKDRYNRRESDAVIKALEAELLLEQSHSASFRVALDPGGQSLQSEELAILLDNWENRGITTICFWIGGHLGLHQSLLKQADMLLSLSRLTFTHEMTRVILLEQLYRACTIKAGHNYHK